VGAELRKTNGAFYKPGRRLPCLLTNAHDSRVSFLFPQIFASFGAMNSKSIVVAKKRYRQHNERVQAVIPKEKLLIYNVKQGWKPLGKFLSCDVLDQQFPK